MNFIKNYLNETIKIIQKLDIFQIKKIINLIKLVKKNKLLKKVKWSIDVDPIDL